MTEKTPPAPGRLRSGIRKTEERASRRAFRPRSVVQNAVLLGLGQAVNRIGLAGFLVIAARLEGESFVGDYSVAVVFASFILQIVVFGSPVLVFRESARRPDRGADLRRLAQRSHLILWIVVVPLALTVASLAAYGEAVVEAIWLLMVWVGVGAGARVVEAQARGLERMEIVAIMNLVAAGLLLVLGTAALVLFRSVAAVAVAMVVERLVTRAVGSALIRRHEPPRSGRVGEHSVTSFLVASAPMAALALMDTLHQRVDLLMLPWFVPSGEVGQYATAARAFEVALLLPALMSAAAFPRLVRLREEPERQKRVLRDSLLRTVMTSAVAGGLGIALAIPVFRAVFGASFVDGARWLEILLLGLPLAAINVNLAWVLLARGGERFLLWIQGALVAANVLLNLGFVPRFGAGGAAAATLLTLGLSTALHAVVVYVVEPKRKPPPAKRTV